MTDLESGSELAGHRIGAVIGRGGESVVYVAHHVRLDRDVALKVLAPQLTLDEAFRRRFVTESQLAAGLDHPNIVPVYDAGEALGHLYLAMRLIQGPDLGEFLEREGTLPVDRTLAILEQVADALDAAHAEGLVHRDVKPGNILLERHPGTHALRAYLSDFGLSKRTNASYGLTRTGTFVGTVEYVSPEQIRGASVDARADVYSLGCVLYRCLAGRSPFSGRSDLATVYAHVNEGPPHLEGSFPRSLDDLVQRALAKDPNERFPTCGELVAGASREIDRTGSGVLVNLAWGADADERLERAATSPGTTWPVRATGPSPSPPGRRRRWRVLLATAAVVAVPAGAFLLLSARGSHGTGGRSTRSPSPTVEDSARPPDPGHLVWQEVTGGLSSIRGEGSAVLDVGIEDGRFVAVGYAMHSGDTDAAVWMSRTGGSWREVSVAGLQAPGEQRIYSVTGYRNTLVGVGWTEEKLRSTVSLDGAVWNAKGSTWIPIDVATLGGPGQQVVRGVVTMGDHLVAAGWSDPSGTDADAAVWVSSNARTWTPTTGAALGGGGDQRIFGLSVVGDRVVAVGTADSSDGTTDAAVWTSSDGIGWDRVSSDRLQRPGDQGLTDVDLVAGRAVAVGTDDGAAAIWRGIGSTWQEEDLPTRDAVRSDALALTRVEGGYLIGGWVEDTSSNREAMIWSSTDGSVWGVADADTRSAADLAGPGVQEIRGLAGVFGRDSGVRAIAFGVRERDERKHAEIWYGLSVS